MIEPLSQETVESRARALAGAGVGAFDVKSATVDELLAQLGRQRVLLRANDIVDDAVYAQRLEIIRELKDRPALDGDPRISLATIGEHAGISQAAVTKALNKPDKAAS